MAHLIVDFYADALGYDLTYEESPGDHQWRYWDQKIADALAWLLPGKGENAWR